MHPKQFQCCFASERAFGGRQSKQPRRARCWAQRARAWLRSWTTSESSRRTQGTVGRGGAGGGGGLLGGLLSLLPTRGVLYILCT